MGDVAEGDAGTTATTDTTDSAIVASSGMFSEKPQERPEERRGEK